MNRTQLIHSLINTPSEQGEFIAKTFRGNTLWTLWNNDTYYIIAYQLIKTPAGWDSIRQPEDASPTTCTCPEKYLALAPIVCPAWREECLKHDIKRKGNKAIIRSLFKQKTKNQSLQVTLKAKEGHGIRLHEYFMAEPILYILSVQPGIEGRFIPNGLRYYIPLRLVSDIRLIDTETRVQNQIPIRKINQL